MSFLFKIILKVFFKIFFKNFTQNIFQKTTLATFYEQIKNKVSFSEFNWICCECLKITATEFPLIYHEPLQSILPKKYIHFLILFYQSYRLYRGIPLAYVIGKWRFLDNDYFVSKDTLIPRPETEELVCNIIDDLEKKQSSNKLTDISILDIGTGSGIIAISLKQALKKKYPKIKITAVDISPQAIKIAKKNAVKILGKNHKIQFVTGDFFTAFNAKNRKNRFDFVITNPPYVGLNEKKIMSEQTLKYEPHLALFSGEKGLNFYTQLAETLPHISKKECWFYGEIGYRQKEDLLKIYSFMKKVTVLKDLSNKDRFLVGEI